MVPRSRVPSARKCPGPYGVLNVVPGSDTTPPAAPALLAIDGTTTGSIALAWEAHPDPDGDLFGFEIYREAAASPGFSLIAVLNDPAAAAHTDFGVTAGETYNYYVLAFDDSFNRSAPSNTVQATAEMRMVSVTFRVSVPTATPGTVYIAGSIPEFGPWDPGFASLTQVDSVTWEYTLDILDGTNVEYKYTRGSWETVEKEADGNSEIPNRSLTVDYGGDGTQLVLDTVENWRDPIVTAFSPGDGAAGVPLGSGIIVAWNQAMPATTSFSVSSDMGPVAGSFDYDPGTSTLIFTPDALLAVETAYTVEVSGQTDVAGDVQQVAEIWTFTTVTPIEAIQQLAADVKAYRDAGVLNNGQANSLLVKLNGAIAKLVQGNPAAAAGRLEAFIIAVEDLIAAGVLPPEDGQHRIPPARPSPRARWRG